MSDDTRDRLDDAARLEAIKQRRAWYLDAAMGSAIELVVKDVPWLLAKVNELTAAVAIYALSGQSVFNKIKALEADKRQLQRDVNYWVELRSVDSRPVIADGNCSSHVLSE